MELLVDKLEETNQKVKPKRRAWLAFVMSIILPGWGQFYNGYATRGLIWFLGTTAYGLAFLHWSVFWKGFGVRGFVFAWSLVLFAYLLSAIEAGVTARRAPKRKRYQKWWGYILVYLFALSFQNLFVPKICEVFRVTLAVKPFTIFSGSMAPN